MKVRKQLTGALLAGVVALSGGQTALGATKSIDSVSVRVSSDAEPGDSLPDISIGKGSSGSGGVSVSGGNGKYTLTAAEWVDTGSKAAQVGAEPRLKVTLEPTDVSENYFLASYKESSVKVSGGTFVSARRDGDNLIVTVRIDPIQGDYEAPYNPYWNEKTLGEAKWEKSDRDSGYYEVQLYRDGKSVYKVDKTTAKTYNFYPYMTEDGDYTFRVRTIPGTDEQKKSGKKSDWAESGELNIEERDVSDGEGKQITKKPIGWSEEGNTWYYYHPDGGVTKNGWENIDGYWYYFDGSGKMLTGWQDIGGHKYYLWDSGQMAVGWARIGDPWYYFRTETGEAGEPAGTMIGPGWRMIGPYYYYFNQDGSMYKGWLWQNGGWYYLNEVDNGIQGAMFTGWIRRDDKTYYADGNGRMVEGWYEIDGDSYYFYPGSGEMAKNTSINGVYVNSDGIWQR